jgi:hypothetical protein
MERLRKRIETEYLAPLMREIYRGYVIVRYCTKDGISHESAAWLTPSQRRAMDDICRKSVEYYDPMKGKMML